MAVVLCKCHSRAVDFENSRLTDKKQSDVNIIQVFAGQSACSQVLRDMLGIHIEKHPLMCDPSPCTRDQLAVLAADGCHATRGLTKKLS